MKKLFLLISILLSLTTCKKLFYKSGVSGQVLDKQSGRPIENVTVYLLGSNAGTSGSPSFDETQKMTTGSDGKFSFSFNRSEYMHYYLYAVPDDPTKYYSTKSHNDYIELDFNRKFRKEYINKDIELLHCGYLKVNFHHTSTDTILFVGAGYKSETNSYYSSMYTDYGAEFLGYAPLFYDNTTYTFCVQGNSNNSISFNITKKNPDGSGTTSAFYFNCYSVSNETISYQFNY